MGLYINVRCTNCGFSFTGGLQRTGVESNLGLPFIKCPRCKSIYKTGKQIYSKMNSREKNRYILSRVCQTLINALLPAILILVIIIEVGNADSNYIFRSGSIFVIYFVGVIISSF